MQDTKMATRRNPPPPLLFQNDFRRNHFEGCGEDKDMKKIPDLAAIAWYQLSEQEKPPWDEKTRIAKAKHRTRYPYWKWTSWRDKKPKKDTKTKSGEDIHQGTSTSWLVEELKDEPYHPPLFLPPVLAQNNQQFCDSNWA